MIDLSWPYWQVVLILVLVDVGLGPPSHRTGDPVACVVLILVLVDVGLGRTQGLRHGLRSSLRS